MTKSKKNELTSVKDFNGTPTYIGDKVVYIYKTYCTSELKFGVVSGFSKAFGRECIEIDEGVGFKSRPTSQSFCKIS